MWCLCRYPTWHAWAAEHRACIGIMHDSTRLRTEQQYRHSVLVHRPVSYSHEDPSKMQSVYEVAFWCSGNWLTYKRIAFMLASLITVVMTRWQALRVKCLTYLDSCANQRALDNFELVFKNTNGVHAIKYQEKLETWRKWVRALSWSEASKFCATPSGIHLICSLTCVDIPVASFSSHHNSCLKTPRDEVWLQVKRWILKK